jgi:hypothetical protein
MRDPSGLTLVEVVLAALIIGGSGVIVMDLVRATTVATEITEVDALARGVAADVLERFAGAPSGVGEELERATELMIGTEQSWEVMLTQDRALALGFPKQALKPILDTADVRITIERQHPYKKPEYGDDEDSVAWTVTARWTDPVTQQRKGVTYARLVAR